MSKIVFVFCLLFLIFKEKELNPPTENFLKKDVLKPVNPSQLGSSKKKTLKSLPVKRFSTKKADRQKKIESEKNKKPRSKDEDYFNIENALPSGYRRDGSIDYTSYIQEALDKHSRIAFPGFPILVNDDGLKIPSNRTITFSEGSEIRLKPTFLKKYAIFNIVNSSNVTLLNPVLIGDRRTHIGGQGEWGMGINITSSTNITIRNVKITDCWGDGIYINQKENDIVPGNIEIVNCTLIGNRRNGISVISVNGLNIKNCYVHGLLEEEGGIRPMSGIDFEPNKAWQELKNIKLSGFKTEHMGAEGIQFRIKNLYSPFVSNKEINIDIANHEDIGSPLAAVLLETKNSNKYPGIRGVINISNSIWRRNGKYILFAMGFSEPNIKINIKKPQIYTDFRSPSSQTDTYDRLMKYVNKNCNLSISF